jgi:hypothetical protein
MNTIIDWLVAEPHAVPILLIGTPILIIGWSLVVARLTRYSERDHRRAYMAHHRAKEEA